MNMNKLPVDVLSIIVDYFIDHKTSTLTIHKIMYIFDSEISKFFCKKYIEFLQKKHKVTDIYDVIEKELNKRSILNYPIIKRLNWLIQENKSNRIIFHDLKAKQRHIVYLFAIYYGYIWFDKVTGLC